MLRGSRDQGDRRIYVFGLLRETEFEDWPHLGSQATKEFLTSIRDGSGNLENHHTNWVRRSGVSEGSAVLSPRMLPCASPSGCSLATIKQT